MQFGICTTTEFANDVKNAGWDFVEESVQGLFQGIEPDDKWTGLARVRKCPLPVPAANMLVPGKLKITGPAVDPAQLKTYLQQVLSRADQTNTRTLVFGSAGARNLPDGFDRAQARQQILDFLSIAAPIAAAHNITLVVEPLNRGESNIINSVAEAMEYVGAVNHPNIQCLLDTYHFWLENEPLANVENAIKSIRHVHLADKDGRVAPGLSGSSDYKPVFAILKRHHYAGLISVEAPGFNVANDGQRVLQFLQTQWNAA
jgi:sugar phosphate isomerase/epimerase